MKIDLVLLNVEPHRAYFHVGIHIWGNTQRSWPSTHNISSV